MKKNWPLLLGATILTGAIGSVFFKKKKKRALPDNGLNHLYKIYSGNWQFTDKQNATHHTIVIDDTLTIFVDEKEFYYTLIELTPKRLVAQDKFGYHIIIQASIDSPATLYDEADDATYILERLT